MGHSKSNRVFNPTDQLKSNCQKMKDPGRIFKEEVGLGWQDCQQAVTDEFLCTMAGCVFGNRCMSLDV